MFRKLAAALLVVLLAAGTVLAQESGTIRCKLTRIDNEKKLIVIKTDAKVQQLSTRTLEAVTDENGERTATGKVPKKWEGKDVEITLDRDARGIGVKTIRLLPTGAP